MRQSIKLALAAAAVSAAFGVQAAEVSLYGSVSTGLVYKHSNELTTGGQLDEKKTNSLSMESGWFGDSIWGITGEEELGNGWTVGFTLENEFASDTGALGTEGTLFDSQAYLRVGNDTFNFAFGNIGGLASAGGDFDMIGGFDPMGAFFDVGGMGAFATRDYASSNMIVAEVTPMEGLKVSFMGSVGEDDSSADAVAWEDRTHYYGIGASYEVGAFAAAAVVEMLNYDSKSNNADTKDDNAYTFTLGVSYDFGVVKPSFVYQHADKLRTFQGEPIVDDNDAYFGSFKYDSFLLGATAPIADGTLMASVQYVKGKGKNGSVEGQKGDATILAVGYSYELSKRTSLWTGATYAVGGDGLDKDLSSANDEFEGMERASFNGYSFGLGLVHTF